MHRHIVGVVLAVLFVVLGCGAGDPSGSSGGGSGASSGGGAGSSGGGTSSGGGGGGGGGGSAFGGGNGSGGGSAGGGSAHPCDGTAYCSDATTKAVCSGGRTTSTLCGGKQCKAGRCGACTGASDCRFVSYRCKCTDGTEKTGTVDSTCGDSQGGQSFCSHPSIASSVCSGHGDLDMNFGYLGTGCVSSVDP